MTSFFKSFLPHDKKFFSLLEKLASNLKEAGTVLNQYAKTSDKEERKILFAALESMENTGDELTHDFLKELSSSFLVPLDRDDIHKLVSAIDEILDYIHGSAKRMELYKIGETSVEIKKLCEIVETQTDELRRVIYELENMEKARNIHESLVFINTLENQADDIFEHALARLFEDEKNAIEIIRQKEVLDMIEQTTDLCEDAAHVIDSIIVKMA